MVLSILDEMENVFVWEHLQSSEGQSRGAWLGMNFNPKGGSLCVGSGWGGLGRQGRCPPAGLGGGEGLRKVGVDPRTGLLSPTCSSLLPAPAMPPQCLLPPGGTLVWQDNTAVNYSNWGPPGLGPSMLSHNSCYWIQSSSGLWRPGACTNITMGVVCKLPRGERPAGTPAASCHPQASGAGWGPACFSFCRQCSGWERIDRQAWGPARTFPGD